MKKYLVLCMLAFALFYSIPLSAAENVKIKLPDGLYMCDSEVTSKGIRARKARSIGKPSTEEKSSQEDVHIKFEDFFIVQNNTIYNSLEALKKFQATDLNKLFAGKKKYKILLAGEKIGAIGNIKVNRDGRLFFDEEIFVKRINENPAYGHHSGLGYAARCIAVPEEYEEAPKKIYDKVSGEEVDRVLKIIKKNLFNLEKNRKEYKQSYSDKTLKLYSKDSPPKNYKDTIYYYEELKFLDKISRRSGEFYIGMYWYHFNSASALQIIFTIKNNNISIITTSHDEETLDSGDMKILGMLDVDGCGEDELLITKRFGDNDAGTVNMEFYKQKADGNWVRIKKFRMRDSWEWLDYRHSMFDAKNAKFAQKYAKNINLPDGLYMHGSWIEKLKNGGKSVRFEDCFVVKNGIIYNSKEALKKFGPGPMNAGNTKYKILCNGEVIGEIYNVMIEDDGYRRYEEKLFSENIKEGPMYEKNKYVRTGSVMACLAVPNKYKAVKRQVYKSLSKEEFEKIYKLLQDKLFHLVINRKEVTQYGITDADPADGTLLSIDKIFYGKDELYIGKYQYDFNSAEGTHDFEIVFCATKDTVYIITSNYDDDTSDYDGQISIIGMLDIDGCGKDELILQKISIGEDEAEINMATYKRKADGNWTRIHQISWREGGEI